MDDIDAAFASSCLATSLELIGILLELWKDLTCTMQVFTHLERFLSILAQSSHLHADVLIKIEKTSKALQAMKEDQRPLQSVSQERVKPKILRLYEPEFETE